MVKKDFGERFVWGTATAAYQIEGAWNADGKEESIWDRFVHTPGKILTGETGDVACDFYRRYANDLELMASLGFNATRFSLSWPRVFAGNKANPAGVDFYQSVIDRAFSNGLEPWVTLYHWDLPQRLEDQGGWINRDTVKRFEEYVDFCTRTFKDVRHWMIFNEPTSFVVLGYALGLHAPGRNAVPRLANFFSKKGLMEFLAASHHVVLAQASGGRIAKSNLPHAMVGSTWYFSDVQPMRPVDAPAARRFDAVINRLYFDPAMGCGYPFEAFPALKNMERYFLPGDETAVVANFDFVGVQNYSRDVVKRSWFQPLVWGTMVEAKKRGVKQTTDMGWEVYPEGIYHVLKRVASYKAVKRIYVTENGAAFPDTPTTDGRVHDARRTQFLQSYLAQVLRAQKEGVPVEGYFVWSFMDNFEWHEGFRPRFGLVYVDYSTQRRIVKDSGLWMQEFLS
jgi:beta-glucosidase